MSVKSSKVTITFNVSFSSNKSGILVVEVDDQETGFNKGKTSGFYPGQPVGLLLYQGPCVTLLQTNTSLGGVSFGGGATVIKEETITFSAPDNLTGMLKYPISSVINSYWIGNSLGGCVINNDSSLEVRTNKSYGIGVFYVKYASTAKTGVLSTPALDLKAYEVGVQVVGNYEPCETESP
jgi:hypothetical protein